MRDEKRMTIFQRFNRFVARLRGSVGWCYAGYAFSRNGMPEEEDEGGTWAAIPPKGIIASWWGAFMFEYKGIDEK